MASDSKSDVKMDVHKQEGMPLYTDWLSRDELTLPPAQIKSADMV